MVSPSDCTARVKVRSRRLLTLSVVGSTDCVQNYKIPLNSPVSSAHRYWTDCSYSYVTESLWKQSAPIILPRFLCLPCLWDVKVRLAQEVQVCLGWWGLCLVSGTCHRYRGFLQPPVVSQCPGGLCDQRASFQNFLCTRKDYWAPECPTANLSSLFVVLLISLLTLLELIPNADQLFSTKV